MNTLKPFLSILLACLLLPLGGCSQGDILKTLEASVAATEVLVTALEVAGKIPAPIATVIENAIATLPDAYTQTAAELASTDSNAVKALKIAGYFANATVALKALPPEAQMYASLVLDAINAFLAKINPTPATTGVATANVAKKIPAMKFSAKDVAPITSRAKSLKDRLAALKK